MVLKLAPLRRQFLFAKEKPQVKAQGRGLIVSFELSIIRSRRQKRLYVPKQVRFD